MVEYPEYPREELVKRLKTVTREDVLRAIQEFNGEFPNAEDYDNWIHNRNYKYALLFKDKFYPCKYIMGQAIRADHPPLNGGWLGSTSVNVYFQNLGFEITAKPW